MTTLAPPQTINYTVTFHWTAESWADSTDEEGNYRYDDQPNADSTPVTVSLPDGASPWEVYGMADAVSELPPTDDEVFSWDADGMTIVFGDRSHFLSGYLINPNTTWAQFR